MKDIQTDYVFKRVPRCYNNTYHVLACTPTGKGIDKPEAKFDQLIAVLVVCVTSGGHSMTQRMSRSRNNML